MTDNSEKGGEASRIGFIAGGKFGVVELRLNENGFWADPSGVVYALRDSSQSLDDSDRCGIYPFVVPVASILDRGCSVHDYLYESPSYQFYHTRAEADAEMLRLHRAAPRHPLRVLALPFYWVARLLGGVAWEGKGSR